MEGIGGRLCPMATDCVRRPLIPGHVFTTTWTQVSVYLRYVISRYIISRTTSSPRTAMSLTVTSFFSSFFVMSPLHLVTSSPVTSSSPPSVTSSLRPPCDIILSPSDIILLPRRESPLCSSLPLRALGLESLLFTYFNFLSFFVLNCSWQPVEDFNCGKELFNP